MFMANETFERCGPDDVHRDAALGPFQGRGKIYAFTYSNGQRKWARRKHLVTWRPSARVPEPGRDHDPLYESKQNPNLTFSRRP
jgi:hypothetical protein